MKEKLSEIYWPLRLAYGLVPLLAGLDKYTDILADWQRYVSPMAASMLPMSVQTFMHLVGIVEIVVGVAVLSGFTRIGGLVVVAWLALISINLVLAGYFDIAVRDVVMAVGAYTLSMVAAERGEELVPSFATRDAQRLAHQ
ncbi:MAG TPA: DoxX family membrane protein [Candidatus Binatia bacterium]